MQTLNTNQQEKQLGDLYSKDFLTKATKDEKNLKKKKEHEGNRDDLTYEASNTKKF